MEHINLYPDPFYSEENMARLRASITQMEATGGTVHAGEPEEERAEGKTRKETASSTE